MRRFAKLMAGVALVSSRAFAADVPPTGPSPSEAYVRRSFALTSGMGVAFPLVAEGGWNGVSTQLDGTGPIGLLGLSANFRAVLSGLLLGAEVGITFIDRVTPSTIFSPGLSVGWAHPLLPRLAMTLALHSVLLLSSAPGSYADVQVTGELAFAIFVHPFAFIEPVVAVGDYQRTGAGNSGQAFLTVGTGYRLGVMF